MNIVRTLICHKDVDTALPCLKSLLDQSRDVIQLLLHDDGTLTEKDAEVLLQSLPGSSILSRKEADLRMEEILKNHPRCLRLRSDYPLSLKLLDVALLSEGDLTYCDTDILFFRSFSGIPSLTAQASAIFMSDPNEAYALRPWHLTPFGPLRLPASVNTGIICFRKNAYDLDYVEWMWNQTALQQAFKKTMCWAEQTCWAALGARTDCSLLSTEQFQVVGASWKPQPGTIAGHFVTSYRSRLPEYFQNTNANSGSVSLLQIIPAKKCGIFRLAAHQAARRTRRIIEAWN